MIEMSHTEHTLLQCFPCAVYSELLPARILLHWSTLHCITVCSLGMYLTAAFFIVVGIPLQCIWLMRPLSQMPWKPVGCTSEMQFSRHPHGISPTWPSFKSKTAILPVRPTFRGSFLGILMEVLEAFSWPAFKSMLPIWPTLVTLLESFILHSTKQSLYISKTFKFKLKLHLEFSAFCVDWSYVGCSIQKVHPPGLARFLGYHKHDHHHHSHHPPHGLLHRKVGIWSGSQFSVGMLWRWCDMWDALWDLPVAMRPQ